MKLPYLESGTKRQKSIVSFGGINHTDSYADGEMREAENISFYSYPSLTVAQTGTEIFCEEGITDFFPFDDGYLIIKNNEARVYRIAEKEQIKISETGWIERFTFSQNDGKRIKLRERIAKGEYTISFRTDGTGIARGRATSSNTYYLEIYEQDEDFAYDRYNLAQKGTLIYSETNKTDSLTVSSDVSSKMTISVSEQLAQSDADKLVSKRYTINGEEVNVIGAKVSGNITYLNFDRKITASEGDKIYPYEYMPKSSSVTMRSQTETDITKRLSSDENFYIYEDIFATSEVVDEAEEITPIMLSEGEKQITRVLNKICIFPDRICYDTRDLCFLYMEKRVICSDFSFNATESTFSSSQSLEAFEAGDGVKFSINGNCSYETANCISAVIKSISDDKKTLYFNSNTFAETFSEKSGTNITEAVITREIPKLEHICSGGGRLWGTLDGVIYASKYGDPCNFQFFEGGAADSYYLEAAGEGEFTACIPYSSYVLFFREREIIKLYGNNPEEFQSVKISAEGVMKGAERSLINLGEVILYRGRSGIWGYTGDYPYSISDKLYLSEYLGGAAGGEGDNYYISLISEENGEKIWVYNLRLGIWFTIKGKAERFINYDRGLCLLSGGRLEKINPKSSEITENEFSVTFCPFFEGLSLKKKYTRFYLTLEVFERSHISIEISVDNAPYKTIKNITNTARKSVTFPIITNRCDTLSVRISGKGNIKIINFAYEYEEGSAIN